MYMFNFLYTIDNCTSKLIKFIAIFYKICVKIITSILKYNCKLSHRLLKLPYSMISREIYIFKIGILNCLSLCSKYMEYLPFTIR